MAATVAPWETTFFLLITLHAGSVTGAQDAPPALTLSDLLARRRGLGALANHLLTSFMRTRCFG